MGHVRMCACPREHLRMLVFAHLDAPRSMRLITPPAPLVVSTACACVNANGIDGSMDDPPVPGPALAAWVEWHEPDPERSQRRVA